MTNEILTMEQLEGIAGGNDIFTSKIKPIPPLPNPPNPFIPVPEPVPNPFADKTVGRLVF